MKISIVGCIFMVAFIALLTSCAGLLGPATTPVIVNISAIAGVTAPVVGASPVTAIASNAQFTGTVSWLPTVVSTFLASQIYTATITLTAKTGFTLTGVSSNYFTVSGASLVSNTAGSGSVTAIFMTGSGTAALLSPPSWIIGTWTTNIGAPSAEISSQFSLNNYIYSAYGMSIDFAEAYKMYGLSDVATSTSYEINYSISAGGYSSTGKYSFSKLTETTLNYSVTTSGLTVGPIAMTKKP